MSTNNFLVGQDIRSQLQHSYKAGRSAGQNFVQQHRHKDKVWFESFSDEVGETVSKLELPKAFEGFAKDVEKVQAENPVAKGLERITDPSSWVTDYLKDNLPLACVKASISCAAYHEVKERGVKPLARRGNARWQHSEAVAGYVCDVLLPTPLYGPFFLFLTGKAREWAVGTMLSVVGLRND